MNRLLKLLTAPALALGALVGTAALVPQSAEADDHRGRHGHGGHHGGWHGGGHHGHGHWRPRHWHGGHHHHRHAYWHRPRVVAAYYPQPVYWQPGPILPPTPYYYDSGLSLVLNVPIR